MCVTNPSSIFLMILIVYAQCIEIRVISVLFNVTILKILLTLIIVFVDLLKFALQTTVFNR